MRGSGSGKCHKITFKCGSSFTIFPDWIKKKKTSINLRNKNDVFNMWQQLQQQLQLGGKKLSMEN